jgi:hypothetical protein
MIGGTGPRGTSWALLTWKDAPQMSLNHDPRRRASLGITIVSCTSERIRWRAAGACALEMGTMFGLRPRAETMRRKT